MTSAKAAKLDRVWLGANLVQALKIKRLRKEQPIRGSCMGVPRAGLSRADEEGF